MDFGTKNVTLSGTGFGFQGVDYKQNVSKVLVGIYYRFDWGKSPVVAKY